MRRALVTGITGQDGSYLAELLLDKGYAVYGVARRSSHDSLERIRHLLPRLKIVSGDLHDQGSVDDLVRSVRPHEIYNLASQSFVPTSWQQPILTGEVTALGTTRLLDAVRRHAPEARFYQASSSEMYGKAAESPQDELTAFRPQSPYAVSKVYAHYITINYRESYGLYAVSGICFNHESPRRGLEFVTRKVTHAVARIRHGLDRELRLGRLEPRRDWGFAGDYVEAMWLMLQAPKPDDFVVATGETHSVQEWVQAAFEAAGLEWKRYVKQDREMIRPAEVPVLLGDASKARRKLKWKPRIGFRELVQMMVKADLERVEAGTR